MKLFLLLLLITLVSAKVKVSEAEFEAAEKEIQFIEQKEFYNQVKNPSDDKTTWFIFFGMNWCPHCREATPGWLKLQQEHGVEFENQWLKLRKVECSRNDDLCDVDQKLAGFPTFRIFRNGELLSEFPEKAHPTFDNLLNYANTTLATIATKNKNTELNNKMMALKAEADRVMRDDDRVNPLGQVLDLDSGSFPKLTNFSSWMVMFHAPWCSHCKDLAPIYEKVAPEFKKKVNIAKVDCVANDALCKQNFVRGFPTLKFFQEGKMVEEFKGDRTVDGIKGFLSAFFAKPSFIPVYSSEIKAIIKKNEVSFFFLHDYHNYNPAYISLISKIATPLRAHSTFYVSVDPSSYQVLDITIPTPSAPKLICISDFGKIKHIYTGSFTPQSMPTINEWIELYRHKLVPELSKANAADILGTQKIVVMGILNPINKDTEVLKGKLRDAARIWYASKNSLKNDVRFVWLDGGKWESYIQRVYGLSSIRDGKGGLPKVIITDPKEDVYFDVADDGEDFGFDVARIGKGITDQFEGKLKPKYTNGWMGFFIKKIGNLFAPFGNFAMAHPLISVILFIAFMAWLMYYMVCEDSKGAFSVVKNDPKAD